MRPLVKLGYSPMALPIHRRRRRFLILLLFGALLSLPLWSLDSRAKQGTSLDHNEGSDSGIAMRSDGIDNYSGGPDSFGYTFADIEADPSIGVRWHDACASGDVYSAQELDGDFGSLSSLIDFPFKYYGVERQGSDLFISAEGFASFENAGLSNADNGLIPDAGDPNSALYPFWDDLDPANSLGITGINPRICVETIGAPGSQRLVVQWQDIPFSSTPDHQSGEAGLIDDGFVQFQLQLEEGGNIRFEYKEPSGCAASDCYRAYGNSASVGIESDAASGPTGLLYSQDSGRLESKNGGIIPAILFQPPQLSIAKNCYAAETVLANPAEATHQDIVIAGQQWVCEVTVSNDGTGRVDGIIIEDTVPAGMLFVAHTLPAPADCVAETGPPTPGAATVSCGEISLEGGASQSFQLGMIPNPDYVAGTECGEAEVCNTVSIIAPCVGDANDSATECDLVKDRADLAITKLAEVEEIRAGEPFVYSIIIENLGPSHARGVRMIDDIISRYDLVVLGVSDDRGGDCTIDTDAGQIACQLSDALEPVGSGGSGRWTIEVEVRSDVTQTIYNEARVTTGDDPCQSTPDHNPANDVASAFVSVLDTSDMTATKTGSGDEDGVQAGELITYDLEISNLGNGDGGSPATNSRLEDYMPAGVSIISVTGEGPNGPATCTAGTPGVPSDPTICHYGTLEVGEVGTMTVVVLVDADFLLYNPDGQLHNRAQAFSDNIDPNIESSIISMVIPIDGIADLSIDKSGPPLLSAGGDAGSYILRVSNAGPSVAENASLVDEITPPAGVRIVGISVIDGPATCAISADGYSLSCDLGNVAVGTDMRQIQVDVAADAGVADGTGVVNTATVTSDTFDPNEDGDPDPSDNTDQVEIAVEASADLSIQKISHMAALIPGTDIAYTIEVKNEGPAIAVNTVVTDLLPEGTSFVYATDNRCMLVVDSVVCLLGDMAPGTTESIDIVLHLDEDFGGGETLINRASVSSDTPEDPEDAGDNVGESSNPTRNVNDLWIRKFGKPDGSVDAGDSISYYVLVTNLGPSASDPRRYLHG